MKGLIKPYSLHLAGLVAFLGVLILLSTCKKEEQEIDPNEFIIAEEVNLISDEIWKDNFISFDTVNKTITFSSDINSTNQIKPGDFIISTEGEGLLRKVSAVNTINNNILVQTDNATLTDVIKQGKIEFNQPLTFSQVKSIEYHYEGIELDTNNLKSSDQTMFDWNIDVVLSDLDGQGSTINDQIKLVGNFRCSWTLIGKIDIGLIEGIKEVNFGFESDENMNLKLVNKLQYNYEKNYTLATINLEPFWVWTPTTPPVPIIFTPQFKIILGIKGYANGSVTFAIMQDLSFNAGIKYLKEDGWSPYHQFDNNLYFQPPQLNVNVGAETYIKPELILKIYSVAGPFANVKLYGRLNANLFETPWWNLYAGISLNAGVKVEILDLYLLEFAINDLIKYEQLLAQASDPPGSPPSADFIGSPGAITAGESVQFTDLSTNTPTSWSWNFGDGGTSTQQNPSHTYLNAGTYTVTLTTSNSYGSDPETKIGYITVNPAGSKPVANFTGTPRTITAGESVQFTDLSTNTPTSWIWDFGDGGTSTQQNPSHPYLNAGTYTVTLTTSNSYGSDPETKIGYITVIPAGSKPVANFTGTPRTITASESVQFTDLSNNLPTGWHWNFGDGDTSANQNPSHSYLISGNYSVVLTASNSYGSDSETKINYITVNPAGNKPVADFTGTPRTVTAGESVQFTDLSTNNPTGWNWDFGDGGISTQQNPLHIFSNPGTCTVSLTVVNSYGTDLEIKTNYILVNETCIGCETDILTDIDGNNYQTVKINSQWWMAENLATTKYNNGNNIPLVTDNTEWDNLNTPAYCWYNNNESTYKDVYGALYNWFTINTGNLCPTGWHVPTDMEWIVLEMALGMSQVEANSTDYRGTNEGGKLKETGTTHWLSPNVDATNESGFTALGGGGRWFSGGTFGNLKFVGHWWTSTETYTNSAGSRWITSSSGQIRRKGDYKKYGFSVRCIKD